MFILRDLRVFNILIYLVMRSLKITMFTRERDVHYARTRCLLCVKIKKPSAIHIGEGKKSTKITKITTIKTLQKNN